MTNNNYVQSAQLCTTTECESCSTSDHSLEPRSPNSSPPQEQNMIERRGRHFSENIQCTHLEGSVIIKQSINTVKSSGDICPKISVRDISTCSVQSVSLISSCQTPGCVTSQTVSGTSVRNALPSSLQNSTALDALTLLVYMCYH